MEDNNFLKDLLAKSFFDPLNFPAFNIEGKEDDNVKQLVKIIKGINDEFIKQKFDREEALSLTLATINMVGNLMCTVFAKTL